MNLRYHIHRAWKKMVEEPRIAQAILQEPPPEAHCLPHFLGIGTTKAGTTWLWRMLRPHPEIFMPVRKEIHFFDNHFSQGLDWYLAHFSEAPPQQMRGEITPAYSILPPARIRVVHHLMPGAKLLYVVRNPIERAWSMANMNLGTNAGNSIHQVSDRAILKSLRSQRSRRLGDYLTNLRHWQQFYPPEQIHLMFFQDIKQRPVELLHGVQRFLGITETQDWSQHPFDPTQRTDKAQKSSPIPPRFHRVLVDLYGDQIRQMHQVWGGPVEPWLASLEAPTS